MHGSSTSNDGLEGQGAVGNDCFIVGIGSSAGGLQPLETFFATIPVETAAAFVVVQHLSPNFRSLTPNFLQRQTQLPVQVIEDGMVLRPRQVFVLPAGFSVIVEGRSLRLVERQSTGIAYPIDQLFLSLAQSGSDRIIGILLSGTGSDGTGGLRALRRAGGIALVQAPNTAQFGAMVENAIVEGVIDQVLPPQELAYTVHDIVNYAAPSRAAERGLDALPPAQLSRILALLQQQEQLDFSQYKPGTLNRRIQHRMVLSKVRDLAHYLELLGNSPAELKRLGQDLLIGSTRFFRDPDLWDFLEQEGLPTIMAALEPGQGLRMWVPACATGEEAYTLAMVVNDVMAARGEFFPIKIFATDIDTEALAVASRGIYNDTLLQEQISPERLQRYFSHEEQSFIVKPSLRDQIVFAPHDLTRNAGFSQMQLISCRNVLIYMQPTLQQQVLRLLHFSLTAQGLLVLGSSEGVGNLDTAFSEVESHLKVFQKTADVSLGLLGLPRQPISRLMASPQPVSRRMNQYDRFLGSILQLGFQDRAVTCVLLNNRNQIVHVFLNSAKLLSFPENEANLTIIEMVPLPLQLPLSTALHRIRRDQQPIIFTDIALETDSPQDGKVSLRIGLAEDRNSREERTPKTDALIVLFEYSPPIEEPPQPPFLTATPLPFDLDAEALQHIADLEFELQQTREHLQSTVAELETTNEEYQATNEELLASNEELQSANEELQSLNEELHTLNAENQTRIEQLTDLNADISNLLSSTDIGVVFLDHNLNIRRFTPAAARIFSLRPTDVGRPLVELTHHLDITDLISQLQQVADTGTPIEQEVRQSRMQTTYLMRLLPYFREDTRRDGVVLTLVDIHELKQTQQRLQRANELLENIYAASPVGLCLLDDQQRYLMVNETLATINGASIGDHLGRTPAEVLPNLVDRFQQHVQQVLETQTSLYNCEITGTTPASDPDRRTWLASYYPVSLLDGDMGVGITISDITDIKRAQAELAEQQAFATQIAESTPDIITIFDIPSGAVSYNNRAIERLLGYSREEIYDLGGDVLMNLVHPDDRSRVLEHFEALMQAADGEILRYEIRILHKEGSWRWFDQRNAVFRRDPQGQPTQVLGISTDITERLAVQQALERSETLFRQTLEGSQVIVFTQDLDLRYTWIYNPSGEFSSEQVVGRTDADLLPPSEGTDQLIAIKRQVLETGHSQQYEIALAMTETDGERYYDGTYSPLYDEAGQLSGLMAVVVDITERKRTELALEQTRQQLEEAQRVAQVGSWQHNLLTQQIQCSQEVFRIFGLNPEQEEPVFETWLSLIHADDRPLFQEVYETARTTGHPFNVDVRIHRVDNGRQRYINIIGKSKSNEGGSPTHLLGTILDITERKQTEAALHRQAFYDQLTQLPNRSLFLEQLKLSIRRTQRDNAPPFAVLYLDVDGFKEINDTLGHLAGDVFLGEVAQRLQTCIRPGDVVARLGGDEFALILEAANRETAIAVAERIQQAFAQPFTPDAQRVDAAASIGIALYTPDVSSESDTVLLENADIAMYRAKGQGPGHIEVFEPQMRSQDMARIELKADLKGALEHQELVLYYQPIVDLQHRRLVGFEALLRWQRSPDGLLSPGAFMDVLQHSHFMYEVELWVLQQAFDQLHSWIAQFPHLGSALHLSINLSPASLERPSIVEVFHQLLRQTDVHPQQIAVEITENSLINTSGLILPILNQLRDMEISLALDDFGTGYSSLSCLHQLPITTIKIDRTFVQALSTDESLMRITSGISALSQILNLKLIAEGIETEQQLSFLLNSGCDWGQGYLFASPLSATDATDLLQHPILPPNAQ